MIIVTTRDVPGLRVSVALGLVRGNTIRARHIGKDIIAGGFLNYSEKQAEKSELYFENGHELMDYFIRGA